MIDPKKQKYLKFRKRNASDLPGKWVKKIVKKWSKFWKQNASDLPGKWVIQKDAGYPTLEWSGPQASIYPANDFHRRLKRASIYPVNDFHLPGKWTFYKKSSHLPGTWEINLSQILKSKRERFTGKVSDEFGP